MFAPNIEYRVEPDADWIELCAVHKGGAFGTDFRMLVDGDGLPGIRKAVLDAIAEFGRRGLTCPPVIIGVGIGATKDQSFSIAKQAAQLRPIGDRHPDPVVAELEDELLEMANSLGIGAMGYPGTAGYATDVHVEIAYTHSALTPLGIHQLFARRRAAASCACTWTGTSRSGPLLRGSRRTRAGSASSRAGEGRPWPRTGCRYRSERTRFARCASAT